MSDKPTCLTCRYFNAKTEYRNDVAYDTVMECRFNPPVIGPMGGQWPELMPDDWCGKHKEPPDA